MAIFKGAGVAIVTPFTENNEVNYEKLGELIEFQIEGGTKSIIICGTTGEASTLTHDEHLGCIKYTVEKVNKRIPVIAGTGSNCTDTAIFLSKEAEELGADGLLVVTPYYNKATHKGLINHFGAIADAVNIPIILYNVPGRTGVNMLPKTIAALVKAHDNIVGVKEASGNVAQVADLMSITKGEIDLYSGCDEINLPLISIGAIGAISVLSNIAPRQSQDIFDYYEAGNVKKSMETQLELMPLINSLFLEVNPIPVKKALNLMGYGVGTLRAPLGEMESGIDTLQEELVNAGIIKSI